MPPYVSLALLYIHGGGEDMDKKSLHAQNLGMEAILSNKIERITG